jgi:hypothetical protein
VFSGSTKLSSTERFVFGHIAVNNSIVTIIIPIYVVIVVLFISTAPVAIKEEVVAGEYS